MFRENRRAANRRWAGTVLAVAIGLVAALGPADDAQAAKLIKQDGDWSSYLHKDAEKTLCFSTSKPKDSAPKNVKRDAIFFYISTWPKDKVRHEISVRVGYPLKPGTTPVAQVGAKRFVMLIEGDRAFPRTRAEEAQMVSALRKGNKLVVTGVSKRGTKTRDVFSLSGVTASMNRAVQACGLAAG